MHCPAGYGHPKDNLKTATENRSKNASFEPFWIFQAQKLGSQKQICESLGWLSAPNV